MLLSPRLQKLHIYILVVRHWMVFLKTRPFVKRNKAEFTNVSSFTSLPMCSTHCTLSCRILLFSLLATKNFFKFVYSEVTGKSAWQVLFRPHSLAVEMSSELDSIWFWISDIQDLPTSCRKFLYFTLFVFSVLYTKNALKRFYWSKCLS